MGISLRCRNLVVTPLFTHDLCVLSCRASAEACADSAAEGLSPNVVCVWKTAYKCAFTTVMRNACGA